MITRQVAEYIVGALEAPLPPEVRAAGCDHLLDTLASIVAGSALPVGPRAIAFAAAMEAKPEAAVIGSAIRTTAMNAALANGIMAHADETDDSHAPSLTHPGCAVVPAALAMGERFGRSGRDVISAVVLGYDIGTRLSMTLGAGQFFDHYSLSSHAFGGYFGACAAASALAGLTAQQAEWALAYTVQMVSGMPCWYRDPDHMEKAFLFGGMPAQGGTQAALMAAAGFTGSAEPLEGDPGLFAAYPAKCDPSRMTDALGARFEVTRTTIKKWSVGSPIQGALDSLQSLVREHRFGAGDVESIHIVLPPRRAIAVDRRDMPAVNIQHQLALLLVDGTITFASGHDEARMASDPALAALRARITVEGDAGQPEGGTAHLAVSLRDGRVLHGHTPFVRGTPQNPMSRDEVAAKAADIMGAARLADIEGTIAAILDIEALEDVRALGARLSIG